MPKLPTSGICKTGNFAERKVSSGRQKHPPERLEWEKEKIERLIQQAKNLRISDDIRNMVQTIAASGVSHSAQADWMNWTLQEAEKIDLRTNGSLEQDMLDWKK